MQGFPTSIMTIRFDAPVSYDSSSDTFRAAQPGLSLLALNEQSADTQVSPGSKQPASDSNSTDQNSWTYLVNLTAEMLPDHAGSVYKYGQLMNLKNLTKNSDSQVIVQEFDPHSWQLKRYEISHGQIQEFKPVKSGGTAQDLQDLLAQAPRSGHLALINEAHGNGDLGFDGDYGKLAISDFQRAIKNGLASTGRSNLDVLSMDSCLMGNVQVLAKLSGLTQNVVASELEETSSVELSHDPPITHYDMQPIDDYLSEMLKQPPKDGREAAAQMLATSSRDCDAQIQTQQGCGTPTLAIYNSQAAPEAERALDKFGAQLQIVTQDANGKKAVDSLAGSMRDVSQNDDHLRDVDDFAGGVIALINKGTIKDSSGGLRQAAQDVLTADGKLVRAQYINPKSPLVSRFGQNSLHGVNTFIPGPDFNIREQAEPIVGGKDAQTLPLPELLNKEIQTSLPDDDAGDWAKFVRSLRS